MLNKFIATTILLSFSLSALSAISPGAQCQSAESLNSEAINLMRANDYAASEKKFLEALNLTANDALKETIHNNFAVLYRRMGNTAEAEKHEKLSGKGVTTATPVPPAKESQKRPAQVSKSEVFTPAIILSESQCAQMDARYGSSALSCASSTYPNGHFRATDAVPSICYVAKDPNHLYGTWSFKGTDGSGMAEMDVSVKMEFYRNESSVKLISQSCTGFSARNTEKAKRMIEAAKQDQWQANENSRIRAQRNHDEAMRSAADSADSNYAAERANYKRSQVFNDHWHR